MNEFTQSEIRLLTSRDDRIIPQRYLTHPEYDPENNLCQCLDYSFIYQVQSRSYSHGYIFLRAIEEFLTVKAQYNRTTHPDLRIMKYTDINSEIFILYQHHLLKNKLPLTYADKFKTAITTTAKETGKLPLIQLPLVPTNKKGGSEPLAPDAFDALETALRTHINSLYGKLKYRLEVDQAQPYTFEEVMNICYPQPTVERVVTWYKYAKAQPGAFKARRLKSLLQRATDPRLVEAAQTKNYHSIFVKTFCDEIAATETVFVDPFAKLGISSWKPCHVRLLKTLLANGFPLDLPHQELISKYDNATLRLTYKDDILSQSLFKLTLTTDPRYDGIVPSLDELLAQYYPSTTDMVSVVLFIMLQTGWNKEVALSIDGHNFEHALTGAIEEALRVVFSEKNRSQGLNKPFKDPTRMNATSRADDPYSLYNLIRLAQKLSNPFGDKEFDYVPITIKEDQLNRLFLCIRNYAEWKTKGGRFTSIANPKAFRVAVQFFLRRYEVVENGRRLTNAGDLTRRLRPTWVEYKKKANLLSIISGNMGHKHQSTTDEFYDDSARARAERKSRLRSEIEAVMELLRSRRFQGLLGAQAQAQAQATQDLKIFHVPGHRTVMWACSDQKKPDWAGANIIISEGRKCFAIDQCIFCSRLHLFDESLPYLMQRLSHIDELLEEDEEGEFRSRLMSEKHVIEGIIDSWLDDEDVVRKAEKFLSKHGPLLPRDLKIFQLIFESEAANV